MLYPFFVVNNLKFLRSIIFEFLVTIDLVADNSEFEV